MKPLVRYHGHVLEPDTQVVLLWHLQLGNVVIPKSTTPSPTLDGLEAGIRLGPDPDERDARPRPGFSSAGGRWVSGS